jgi:hypothetical protein
MTGTIRREEIINRSADDVWGRIKDPADHPSWFVGMATATVEGDIRTITTGSGLPLPEKIVTVDGILRRFQYSVTSPFFKFHLGTIDVFDLGDGRSLVCYSTDCDPDAMALIIGGAAGGALKELKRQMESGNEAAERITPPIEEHA